MKVGRDRTVINSKLFLRFKQECPKTVVVVVGVCSLTRNGIVRIHMNLSESSYIWSPKMGYGESSGNI